MALIYALSPVFIALVSSFWLGERPGRLQCLGIVLAFAKLVHVVIKGQWLTLAQVKLVAGDLWILGANVSWTLYSIFLKRWSTDFNPIACLVLIIIIIISGGVLLSLTQTPWGWKTSALVIAAGLVSGAGANLAWSTLKKAMGAACAGLTLYLGLLNAVVVDAVFLDKAINNKGLSRNGRSRYPARDLLCLTLDKATDLTTSNFCKPAL